MVIRSDSSVTGSSLGILEKGVWLAQALADRIVIPHNRQRVFVRIFALFPACIFSDVILSDVIF